MGRLLFVTVFAIDQRNMYDHYLKNIKQLKVAEHELNQAYLSQDKLPFIHRSSEGK